MNVKDIMVGEVITVEADSTVKDAVKLMNKHEIGCLIVEEEEKVVGIVTERDFLKRIIEDSRDPEKTKISEIMTNPLIVGSVNMKIEDAIKNMFTYKIKKLPVVENGHLVGLVTLTDIARIAGVESLIIKVIRGLRKSGYLPPPKRMTKIFDYYIT